MANNLLYHFSGGSTDKQKTIGVWVEHGGTFEDKWDLFIGDAMQAIMGTKVLEESELSRLKRLNDRFKEEGRW